MGKDYYAILGIDRSVDQTAIQKAYRKLALRWHPDKNPDNVQEAQAKFQEISEAYGILSDPDKRRTYDQFGEEGLNGHGGMSHGNFFDPNEIFRQFFGGNPFGESHFARTGFGGGGPFHSGFFTTGFDDDDGFPNFTFGFGQPSRQQRAPTPMSLNISCSLEQLFTGETKKIKVQRKVNNKQEENVLSLEIKPGWKDGTKVTFPEEGDRIPGQKPQDVVFIIKERKHDRFIRAEDDLIYNKELSLVEALCGVNSSVKGIDGNTVPIKTDQVVTPNSEIRISNQGMPKKTGERGILIIRFTVSFPTQLSDNQKSLIKNALSSST